MRGKIFLSLAHRLRWELLAEGLRWLDAVFRSKKKHKQIAS